SAVVSAAPINRLYLRPGEPMTDRSAPRRFLPLRLRRQPIPVRRPLRVGRARPVLVNGRQPRLVVIAGHQPLLFAPRIAPLHTVPPVDRLHRMVRRLPRTRILIAVSIAPVPPLD